MSALWSSADAAGATGARAFGAAWAAARVAIDSRGVRPGDLFVALRGPSRDGHDFVAAALEAGAAAALVARRPAGLAAEAPLLLVEDTQAGLEALGQAGRARAQARIAAVTGSVGKTGTKEALRLVLEGEGRTHASAKSHNNHWGVPLTLANMAPDAAYAVIELGMNHAGEIALLVRQVRPHVALVTRIAPAHLGHFDSVADIARAKAEIFAGLEPGGIAVLGRDDEQFPLLESLAHAAGVARVLTFGTAAGCDARLIGAREDEDGSEVEAELAGRRLAFRIGAPGRHWVLNALAVLLTVQALGADPVRAAARLAGYRPGAGRGRRLDLPLPGGGRFALIDDSYNANPASMRAALDVLGHARGRRLAALGDMLELGEHAPALHAGLCDAIEAAGVARAFTCGPAMAHLHAALPARLRGAHAESSAALLPALRAALRPGDVLLVKGSLGSRMAAIVQALAEGEG